MRKRRALAVLCLSLLSVGPLGAQQSGSDDDDFPAPKRPAADDDDDSSLTPQERMQKNVGAAQERMHQQISDEQERQADSFVAMSARMQAQYDGLEQRMAAQHAQFVARVSQQWSDVKESTDKTWVDYGESTDARSRVDFEAGEVEVEVLVPLDAIAPGKAKDTRVDQLDSKQQAKLRALAEEKLQKQTQRMLSQREHAETKPGGARPPAKVESPKNPPQKFESPKAPPQKAESATPPAQNLESPKAPAPPKEVRTEPPGQAVLPEHKERVEPPPHQEEARGEPVLDGQLRSADGKPVTEKDAAKLVKEELAPKMEIDPRPVVAEDGRPRVRVKVKIAMIPDHLRVRAGRYAEKVNAEAQRLGISPELIFAVIHTESAFNPLAHSGAGAYGLMQLIPKQGAHEAYRHLYKKDAVVTPDYLLDPDHNIELGATYLQMLQSAFFGKLKSPQNRETLSIASYNCGPTKVKRDVMKDKNVDAMSAEEVVALVQQRAPKETKDYLTRVRSRMSLYRARD